jgi:hypothetical protein
VDRRTFLASAAALVAMPPLPTSAGAVTETYATCPAGFALRSWSQDGRSYKAVVPVQRYGEEGGCRWTRYVESMEQSDG